jgi:hypothetical protein
VGEDIDLTEVSGEELDSFLGKNIESFKGNGGVVLFLYSVILTRGIDRVSFQGGEFGTLWIFSFGPPSFFCFPAMTVSVTPLLEGSFFFFFFGDVCSGIFYFCLPSYENR